MYRVQQPVPLCVERVATNTILNLDGCLFLGAVWHQILVQVFDQLVPLHDFAQNQGNKYVVHGLDMLPHQIVQKRRFLLE